MDYAAQLEAKRRRLEALLGGLVKPEGIEPAEEPLRYRTKVHAVLGRSRSGLMAGTYAAGTHRIVDSRGCLIEDARCREALDAIVSVLRDFRVQPYDEDARRGLARHILIRRAAGTGEMLPSWCSPGRSCRLRRDSKAHTRARAGPHDAS